FPASGFPQRLSVYDGVLTIDAKDVTARVFGWPVRDVMVIQVDDRRANPAPAAPALPMLRHQTKYFGDHLEQFVRDQGVTVETCNDAASSRLVAEGRRIALTQEFREGDFCCKSAVAIAIVGRTGAPRIVNETDVALETQGGPGAYTILVSSAATF